MKDLLHSQAVELELNMLAVLQYDFEFEYPFTYVKHYFSIVKQQFSQASSSEPAAPDQDQVGKTSTPAVVFSANL